MLALKSMSSDIHCKAEGKVVPVLFFLNCVPRHENLLGEWRYSFHAFLTSLLDRGAWSVLCPGRFNPSERTFATHWIGRWVNPRVVLDTMVKREIPSPRTPIVQPVASGLQQY